MYSGLVTRNVWNFAHRFWFFSPATEQLVFTSNYQRQK